MAKVVLADLSSFASISSINENFSKIEDALNNKVLWRDNPSGQPNQMEGPLDMNSNDIINAGLIKAKNIVAESLTSGDAFPIAGGLKDNELVKWNKTTNQLEGTGVTSSAEGELTTSNNSIDIGVHKIGSMGENVGFHNYQTNRLYFPAWQGVGELDSETYNAVTRDHGAFEEGIVRESGQDTIMVNPAWTINIPHNETLFRIGFYCSQPVTELRCKVSEGGTLIYNDVLEGTGSTVGMSEFRFHTPLDIYANKPITVELSSDSGNDVYVKGSSSTTLPAYSVWIRTFTEKPLATEEYVAQHSGGTGGGDMFKSVYDKNDNDIVDEAEALTGVSTAGNSKYYGTNGTGQVGFFDIPTGEVTNDQFNALKATVDGHTTALNNHGSEIQQHENEISTNTSNIQVAMQHSQAALNEANQVRSAMVTGIVPTVDHTAKTITFTLTSNSGAVDHAMVDLSSWFAGTGPAPQDFAIWSGWSQHPPMDEAEIQRLGTKRVVRSLNGLEIILSRSDTTPKHMWVWIPSAHPAKGFNFSGFTSVWQSYEVNVAGVDGKFYYSPNPTSATNVTFEVEA